MTTPDGTSPVPGGTGEIGDTTPDEWAGPGSAGKATAPADDATPLEWAGPGSPGRAEAPPGDPDEWAGPGSAGRAAMRPDSSPDITGGDAAYDDGDSRIFPEGDG